MVDDEVVNCMNDIIKQVERIYWKTDSLQFGDHVCVPRLGGLYYHHGIYVGDNRFLHCQGDVLDAMIGMGCTRSHVCVEDAADFKKHCDSDFVLINKNPSMGEYKHLLGPCAYNIFTNNCEHFANTVSVGIGESVQARRLAIIMVFVLCMIRPDITLPIVLSHFVFNNRFFNS